MTSSTGRPVALVTGGASGIGRASAAALLRADVDVVLADVDGDALDRATSGLVGGADGPGGRVHTCLADVATRHGAEAAVRTAVDAAGRLDLMHLNAGRPGVGPLTSESDIGEIAATLTTNVMAAVTPLVVGLVHLEHSPSAAVTITSSLAGLVGSPADPVYAASKHALVGLVRSLAPAHPGIRINAVCPSLVATPMIPAFVRDDVSLPVLAPSDVAAVVLEQLVGEADGQVLFLESGRGARVVSEPSLSRLQEGV